METFAKWMMAEPEDIQDTVDGGCLGRPIDLDKCNLWDSTFVEMRKKSGYNTPYRTT